MRRRSGRMGFVASSAGVLLSGAFACSSSSGGSAAITTLPSSDPVSKNADQLCADIKTYLVSLIPSVTPFVCAEVAAGEASDCSAVYQLCASEASTAASGDAGSTLITSALQTCDTSLAGCSGVTVGQVTKCLSDFASAIQSASSGISADSACSGANPTPPSLPAEPASCSALPASCDVSSKITSSLGGG